MKKIMMLAAMTALALAPAAKAQRWEFGVGVGGSIYPSNTITNGTATANVDIKTSLAGGVWLANDINNHWGGEARLDYSQGNIQLSNSTATASFLSESYNLHYDIQYHFTSSESRLRPYVAAGAGVRYFRGIGSQVLFQPLSQFALLTQDNDLKPEISVAGGLKFKVTDHLGIRLEVHDYLMPFPTGVITPNTGSKISGWMQNIVPMAGISYLF